jgi:PAS domain S-box-containing protein
MIAAGAPLTNILECLCDTIDDHASGIISTAMLMDRDGKRLWPVAGRRVPKEWIAAITPLTIGACAGTCGTAAFRRERVITRDIAAGPLIDHRDLALRNGLRAAWSQPLLSKNHQLLGTFAFYYAEPRTPSECDLQLIEEEAVNVAVIAIEGERARTALEKASEEIKKSEAELRTIIDAIPQLIIAIGADGKFLYANQTLLEYTGLTKEEVQSDTFLKVFHPEDTERLRDEREAAIARGVPFEYQRRVRRRDDQYRWILVQIQPAAGRSGKCHSLVRDGH